MPPDRAHDQPLSDESRQTQRPLYRSNNPDDLTAVAEQWTAECRAGIDHWVVARDPLNTAWEYTILPAYRVGTP